MVNRIGLASQIANTFQSLGSRFGINGCVQKEEIRDYIFATDTRGTSNASTSVEELDPRSLSCARSGTTSMLIIWLPFSLMIGLLLGRAMMMSSEARDTRLAIESYIENKMRMSNFRATVSQSVYDFIDYGNAFAMTEFVDEST
jgi:L-cystine uptake protein TcyP (sodium:dicarboxylate symporter family)